MVGVTSLIHLMHVSSVFNNLFIIFRDRMAAISNLTSIEIRYLELIRMAVEKLWHKQTALIIRHPLLLLLISFLLLLLLLEQFEIVDIEGRP